MPANKNTAINRNLSPYNRKKQTGHCLLHCYTKIEYKQITILDMVY